ncbi:MAG: response regulator [Myxococcales bacterium]|nr:response regulator [Myxococcales bacterium]
MIIDEDPGFRKKAARFLSERSFDVFDAEGADAGLAAILRYRPDFVLVDVHQKVARGVNLIETIAQSANAPQVIAVANAPRLPDVVAAVKAGAVDVLERPVDGERLVALIQEFSAVEESGRPTERPVPVTLRDALEIDYLVSESSKMQAVLHALSRLAPSEQVLVLVGSRGCRLDAVARYFHRVGPRAEGPFVAVPRQDAEERLFGSASRTSAFAEAKGGIVFIESLLSLGSGGQERLTKLIQGCREIGASDRALAADGHRERGVVALGCTAAAASTRPREAPREEGRRSTGPPRTAGGHPRPRPSCGLRDRGAAAPANGAGRPKGDRRPHEPGVVR